MADDDGPKTTRRELLGAVAILATGVGLGCDAATGVPDGGGGGLDASARPDPGRGSDGGSSDAGTADAGAADAGPPDAGVPPAPPPEETPEALVATFPLGVSSGDATHEAAIFWTQYAGARELELVVWEMEGASYGRTVTQELVTLAEGGYVHVDVSGLRAGARHRYAFFERERVRTMRSPIGRLRAALDPEGVEPMVIGACSCTSNSRTADTLSRAGAREDLDVFLLLGDTTYNDGAETATEYRDKWRESLARPGYRDVRAASSLLCTWDDHEFENDFDPDRMPAAQLAAARQTYFEHQPVRRDAAFPDRIWKSMRWGLTAEIFLLDCRSEILEHIAREAIRGVLWVAGDFHLASAQRVSGSGAGATQIEILAGPGAQTGNILAATLGGAQFDFATSRNNYTVIELDPGTGQARVWWIDGSGSTTETMEYSLA